ncbi:hypothetical protein Nepgr_023403 [Nepenthes gracilis]|uniref:Uncharacterized protein n=1 Tax=Nepenthes gracilis TaxID=150966 RepID=A0AAD3T483_NEPGR|nr:hypothetical protein Nepgr_023403 [Nepenthes gracilis]
MVCDGNSLVISFLLALWPQPCPIGLVVASGPRHPLLLILPHRSLLSLLRLRIIHLMQPYVDLTARFPLMDGEPQVARSEDVFLKAWQPVMILSRDKHETLLIRKKNPFSAIEILDQDANLSSVPSKGASVDKMLWKALALLLCKANLAVTEQMDIFCWWLFRVMRTAFCALLVELLLFFHNQLNAASCLPTTT